VGTNRTEMFEPCYISSFLSGTLATTGISNQEYVRNYCKVAVKRHHQIFPRTARADIIAAINLSKLKVLRFNGKIWNQISSGSFVWLVSKEEWDLFLNYLNSQPDRPTRHGKQLVYHSPSSLSPKELKDFVMTFCECNKFSLEKNAVLDLPYQNEVRVASPALLRSLISDAVDSPRDPIFARSMASLSLSPPLSEWGSKEESEVEGNDFEELIAISNSNKEDVFASHLPNYESERGQRTLLEEIEEEATPPENEYAVAEIEEEANEKDCPEAETVESEERKDISLHGHHSDVESPVQGLIHLAPPADLSLRSSSPLSLVGREEVESDCDGEEEEQSGVSMEPTEGDDGCASTEDGDDDDDDNDDDEEEEEEEEGDEREDDDDDDDDDDEEEEDVSEYEGEDDEEEESDEEGVVEFELSDGFHAEDESAGGGDGDDEEEEEDESEEAGDGRDDKMEIGDGQDEEIVGEDVQGAVSEAEKIFEEEEGEARGHEENPSLLVKDEDLQVKSTDELPQPSPPPTSLPLGISTLISSGENLLREVTSRSTRPSIPSLLLSCGKDGVGSKEPTTAATLDAKEQRKREALIKLRLLSKELRSMKQEQVELKSCLSQLTDMSSTFDVVRGMVARPPQEFGAKTKTAPSTEVRDAEVDRIPCAMEQKADIETYPQASPETPRSGLHGEGGVDGDPPREDLKTVSEPVVAVEEPLQGEDGDRHPQPLSLGAPVTYSEGESDKSADSIIALKQETPGGAGQRKEMRPAPHSDSTINSTSEPPRCSPVALNQQISPADGKDREGEREGDLGPRIESIDMIDSENEDELEEDASLSSASRGEEKNQSLLVLQGDSKPTIVIQMRPLGASPSIMRLDSPLRSPSPQGRLTAAATVTLATSRSHPTNTSLSSRNQAERDSPLLTPEREVADENPVLWCHPSFNCGDSNDGTSDVFGPSDLSVNEEFVGDPPSSPAAAASTTPVPPADSLEELVIGPAPADSCLDQATMNFVDPPAPLPHFTSPLIDYFVPFLRLLDPPKRGGALCHADNKTTVLWTIFQVYARSDGPIASSIRSVTAHPSTHLHLPSLPSSP
jgi:hypothetical protein